LAVILMGCLFGPPAVAETPPLTHALTPVQPPAAAPGLRLPDLDDEVVDLRELRGRVVVVNFWATWCPPCRREMPSLERLNQAAQDKGVSVLAVNIGEDVDTVFSFIGMLQPAPSFPLLFDPNADSLPSWKVQGLPTTYVVAPDGSIAYRAVGGREFDHPDLVRQLIELAASATIP
jgi:thiol-disulfide isomerase/thioredoxin